MHVDRWQDEVFRACMDTFSIGTILLVVDFAEKYNIQPKRKSQSQYYHSDKVIIMVHITYRHVADSTEEKRVILKDITFT